MVKAKWLKWGLLILVLGLMSTGYGGLCKKDKDHDTTSGSSALTITYAANTKVIDQSTMDQLSFYDGTVFTFTNTAPIIQNLTVDDIMVSIIDDGFLRKVTAITPTVDSIIIETDEATLEDLIVDGSFNVNKAICPQNIISSECLQGVSLAPIPIDKAVQGSLASFQIDINDASIGPVTLNGEITLASDYYLDIKISNRKLQTLIAYTDITESIELSVDVSGDITKEIQLGKWTFAPVTIGLVIIFPELVVKAGVEGYTSTDCNIEVSQGTAIRAGLQYTDGEWGRIYNATDSFNCSTPSLPEQEASARVYIRPEVHLKLYKIAGPKMGVEGYFKARINPGSVPWWTISGGVNVKAGAEVKICGKVLADVYFKLAEKEWIIAQQQPSASSPNPPSGLITIPISPYQINLNWSDNSDNETQFKIERKSGTTWQLIATVGEDVTFYHSNGLKPDTTYYYQVKAINPVGESAWSDEIPGATLVLQVSVPTAPSQLIAYPLSSSEIDLSWNDANNEIGYRIERRTGSTGNWQQITSLPPNTTSYYNTGLTEATTYYYRIRAYNAAGNSAYSNVESATTPSPSGETVSPPNRPTSTTAGTTGTSYNYSTGGASSNLGHSVEYRFDWGNGTYSNWSSSTSASKTWSSANTYIVKVQARCATHTSVVSNWSSGLSVNITNKWIQVACGSDYTLGLKTDGTLWAWGRNDHGQLGDGTTINKSSPVQIAGTTWKQVACGWGHTLGLKTDGTLWAWGHNSNGALGDGTWIDKSSPVPVGAGTTWQQIACEGGSGHTLGFKTDGTLWAWGWNNSGRLGDGTTINKSSPVQIAGSTWNYVVCGGLHTLAIKTDGTLWAWGNNDYGSLGDGTQTSKSSPVQIVGSTWNYVACGGVHTLGFKTDGTLWAWGWNNHGQLGDGTYVDKTVPTQIAGTTWSAIAAGNMHTIALKLDNTLWAWGHNSDGQLGLGDTTDRNTPTRVGTDTTWSGIACGIDHTIVLKTDGTLWAWGSNSYGQLGDGTYTDKLIPTLIVLIGDTHPIF